MGRKLLISDTNIIIDIVAGELVEAMFTLEYEFAMPDILYAEELEEQHPEILAAGLKVIELKPESISRADRYFQENMVSRVSVNDCLALSLAKQENCPLLTGDLKLKGTSINCLCPLALHPAQNQDALLKPCSLHIKKVQR